MFTFRKDRSTFYAPDEPPAPAPIDPPADPPKDEWTPPTREEWEAQRQQADKQNSALAKYRRDAEAAEKAAKAAQEEQAKKDGEWQKIAEARERERDEAHATLQSERAKAAVLAKASELKFRRPAYALALLPAEVDRNDAAAVEAALRALLEDDPDLIASDDPARPTGRPAGGSAPAQTIDEQIAEAEAKKDWKTAGKLKAQKVAAAVQSSPTIT